MADTLDKQAQDLRRAHCARADKRNHECVGVCVIDRGGTRLSCDLCGVLDRPHEEPEAVVEGRARAIVEAAGMRWESISEEAQEKAIKTTWLPWTKP